MGKKSDCFPFSFRQLSREGYEFECLLNGYAALLDEECMNAFFYYNADRHGSGHAIELAVLRGGTAVSAQESTA